MLIKIIHLCSASSATAFDPQTTICFAFSPLFSHKKERNPGIKIIHPPHHHLSLNREGRWGTTDNFATILLLWTCQTPGLSIPSWCLPTSFSVCLVFFPFSLWPCKMVLAGPDERETLSFTDRKPILDFICYTFFACSEVVAFDDPGF